MTDTRTAMEWREKFPYGKNCDNYLDIIEAILAQGRREGAEAERTAWQERVKRRGCEPSAVN